MKQVPKWTDDKAKWRRTLLYFHSEYQCPDCAKMYAFYLETCKNPLHRLHDALYELEKEIARITKHQKKVAK
jgi:transcription initiation factor IIE alpha subunit